MTAQVSKDAQQHNHDALLLRTIDAIRNGTPNYDQMSDKLSDDLKRKMPRIEARVKSLGAAKIIEYVRRIRGDDNFKIHHENGTVI